MEKDCNGMSKRQMNYNLIEGRIDRNKYDVVETTTNQIINSFPGEKFLDARSFMRHLNLGGGFDGWTPNFFLNNVQSYINKTSDKHESADDKSRRGKSLIKAKE
jgi:hypothetical protein